MQLFRLSLHLTSVLLPGGCCFKPQTAKDGLRLFEIETVLSLEQRTLKEKLDPSSISEVSGCRSLSTNLLDVIETWYADSAHCLKVLINLLRSFILESFDQDLQYTWVWWISTDVTAKPDKRQSDSDRVVSDRCCYCIEADDKPGQVSLIGPHPSAENSFFTCCHTAMWNKLINILLFLFLKP